MLQTRKPAQLLNWARASNQKVVLIKPISFEVFRKDQLLTKEQRHNLKDLGVKVHKNMTERDAIKKIKTKNLK